MARQYTSEIGKISDWGTKVNEATLALDEAVQVANALLLALGGEASSPATAFHAEHNPNGTHKTTVGRSDFLTETDAVSQVSATSFTVAGDHSSVALPGDVGGQAVRLNDSEYGYVCTASYDGGADLTTVTVQGVSVPTPLTKVEWGPDPRSFAAIVAGRTVPKAESADEGGVLVVDGDGNFEIQTPTTFRDGFGYGSAAMLDANEGYTYLYVSAAGSDDTGDGTSGSPYATVERALTHVGALLPTMNSLISIYVDGWLTGHGQIDINRPGYAPVIISGLNSIPVQAFTVYSVGAISGNVRSVVLNVTDASVTEVGQAVSVENVVPSSDQDVTLTGCWLVTAVDTVNNRITLAIHDYSGKSAPTTSATGNVAFFVDGIVFDSDVHGINFYSDGCELRSIQNIALISPDGAAASNRYAVHLAHGCKTWLNGRVGINGWLRGLNEYHATVDANDAVISACDTGVFAEGGFVSGPNIIVTGSANRGIRCQSPGAYTFDGGSKVVAGNNTGIYAYYGAYVEAVGGNLDQNSAKTSPGESVSGNWLSLVRVTSSYRPSPAAIRLARLEEFLEIPIVWGTTINCVHDFYDSRPLVMIALKCLTAEYGYSAGDRVVIGPGCTDYSRAMGIDIRCNTNSIDLILGSSPLAVISPSTGAQYAITAANWELEAYVWSE